MPAQETSLEGYLDPEAALVQRAKERSPSAWAEIYDTCYKKLYSYLYARAGPAAEDLTAKVFLEAFENIDSFTYRGRPLLAWLYRIARNVASDYLHKRSREATASALSPLVNAHASDDAAWQNVAERLDLVAALQKLTEEQQHVLALRYFAGLSTSEIAQALGKGERAVYSLQARAIAALRRILGAEAK